MYSKKWVWQSLQIVYFLSSDLQVLETSTDLNSEISAPFKAGTSRQVQTCLQYTKIHTKKYNILTGSF